MASTKVKPHKAIYIAQDWAECCTLDEAVRVSDGLEGVRLNTLTRSDTIHARTLNSDYELTLIDPASGQVRLKGGKSFASSVEATVSGSTFGGWMIKLGWLGVGLRMEFNTGGQRFVTTPVQSLTVTRGAVHRSPGTRAKGGKRGRSVRSFAVPGSAD